MKKYLLFIISAFILVFTLSSCDTSDLENEYHDFHIEYNAECHYDICDCGHKEHEEKHIFSDAIHMIQKESCSQEGIYEYHCIGCDYTKEVRKDKLPHEFGDWETTVETTCLNQGQQKRVCKNCGYEEFKDTNKAPHTPVAYDTVDADCTHEGHTGGSYCSVCKEELSEQTTINKTDHNYGAWITVDEPTCTSIGSAERECSVCGHKEHKTLNKLPHTVTYFDDDPSTCIHKGHTGGSYCSVCNTILEERTELDLTSHKYGDWITTDEPTCTQIGHAKRVCEVCGNTEYKDLDMVPHTSTPYTDLEANCQHDGHIGGTYCSVCNQELTPYTTVDKTGHDYTDWEEYKAPTCITTGQDRRECNICHHEEYRDVDKIAHTPIPGTALASTCLEHGHTEGSYCSFCHVELEAPEELPLGGHNYSIETVTKQATLNTEGELTHTCSVCGDSYTTTIEKLPLTQKIWSEALAYSKFNDKYMEIYYQDLTLNKEYDILIKNKDDKTYARIYDHATGKVFEFYHGSDEVVESAVEGYRHRVGTYETDLYYKYLELVYGAIYYSSFSYDQVERKDGYFLANGITAKNYKGETESNAMVAIQIDDNGLVEMFAYSSSNYFINIQTVGDAETIIIPNATHHHIVDGKCDVCNEQYYTYTTTKNNMNLSYYVNKNNGSVEFDYELINSNQADVTFVYPTYTEYTKDSANIKRFTTLYYEGTSNYYSKQVKSFTINSNKLLKITYKDNSIQRLLLLNDGTAITVSSDSAYANNPYNGNPVGQTFDLVQTDKTIRYYIKSDSEIIITEYKEINYYIIGDKQFINFNSRTLEKVFGITYMSDNGNGVKPDGSKDYIYFVLNSNFTLEIYYTGISSSLKAFNTVTFQTIEGYYNQGGKDFTIYFRGDNIDYKLHYNTSNIEISYA